MIPDHATRGFEGCENTVPEDVAYPAEVIVPDECPGLVEVSGGSLGVPRPTHLGELVRARPRDASERGAAFDDAIRALGASSWAQYCCFAFVNNASEYFHDTDHLNQAGVLTFFEDYLARILAPEADSEWLGRVGEERQ